MSIKKYKSFLIVLCYSLVLGLIAYGYVFVNYTPSHDGMMVYTKDQEWMLAIGRFMVKYYTLVRGNVNAPWFIGMLGLIYTSVASFLTSKVLSFDNILWKMISVATFFLLNISMISAAGVYIYIFDILAFGMMLAVLAVYVVSQRRSVLGTLGSALLLALAMGCYQSFLAVTVGLFMLVIISDVLRKAIDKSLVISWIKYMVSVLAGVIFYAILMKLTMFINGVEPYSGAYNSITNVFSTSIVSFLKLIPNSYKSVIKFFLFQNVYDSKAVVVLTIVLVAIGSVAFVRKMVGMNKINVIVLCLLLAFFPLATNCIYVISGGMVHNLMMGSYSLLYVLCIMPIPSLEDVKSQKSFEWCGIRIAIASVFIIGFMIVRFSNGLFYYQKLVGIGTETAMTNIVYDVERCADYVSGDTRILLVGNITEALSAIYRGTDSYAGVTGMTVSGTTITYNDVFINYIDFILGKRYGYLVDEDIIAEIMDSSDYKIMPCYPTEGYCKMINGNLVLKFTEK